jgi:hypothetical protein
VTLRWLVSEGPARAYSTYSWSTRQARQTSVGHASPAERGDPTRGLSEQYIIIIDSVPYLAHNPRCYNAIAPRILIRLKLGIAYHISHGFDCGVTKNTFTHHSRFSIIEPIETLCPDPQALGFLSCVVISTWRFEHRNKPQILYLYRLSMAREELRQVIHLLRLL